MRAPQRPFSTQSGRSASPRQQWANEPEASSTGAEAVEAVRRSGAYATHQPGIVERLGVARFRFNEFLKKHGYGL